MEKIFEKLTRSNFRIRQVEVNSPFKVSLYGIRSPYIAIDTAIISASPLELVRLRLKSIYLKNINLFLDSFPHKDKETSVDNQKTFNIPEFPFFLATLRVQNLNVFLQYDSMHVEKFRADFKGTTHNFFAHINIEDAGFRNYQIDFMNADLFRIGNSFKMRKGELCSNILCVENLRAGYDSLLTASMRGVAFKGINAVVGKLNIELSPDLNYGNVNVSSLEVNNRFLKNGKISFTKTGKDIKYVFEITSEWLRSTGNGRLRLSSPVSYSLHFNRIYYRERDAEIKAKLFIKGKKDSMGGLLRITSANYRDKDLGTTTVFFRMNKFRVITLDSVFVINKKSVTWLSAILTPDSQFIYVKPDLYIEDYINNVHGHISGEMATTILKNREIYPNAKLKINHFSMPYADAGKITVNIHGSRNDSIFVKILMEKLSPRKGPLLDTLSLEGIIANLSFLDYAMSIKLMGDWFYLSGNAYKGPQDYTVNIDTVYGMFRQMHIFSERALYLSYKNKTFYITTGNIYVENGRFRLQGTLVNSKSINMTLITDSLTFPYSETSPITLNTTTQITGEIENPIFVSMGEIYNPVIKGVSARSIEYSISFVRQTLLVEYLKIYRNGGVLSGTGNIMFPQKFYSITDKVYDSIIPDLSIKFENFDITPLFSFINDVYSTEYAEIGGYINIKGTLKKPFMSGGILLKGSNGYLPAVGIRIDRLKGYLQFAGDELIIKSIRGESDAGEVIAIGKITSTENLFDSPDITISAKDIYLEIGPEIQALCDAHLSLIKGDKTPLFLKGDVNVKEGYLYAEFSSPRTVSREESNPVLSLNLNISWEKNVYLINEIAEIEFSGKLSYFYGKSGMLMNGSLTVLDGSFSYFDKLFRVDEGSVTFNNLSIIDPELNISAITDVDSYSIRLNVSGTLTEPVINLSSEPPLDESNIIALLTFGKLLTETEAGLLSKNLIEKKALGFAQSYLLRNIRRRLGLRELEVSSGSLEEDPHFIIGFYVTRDIYLKYYHDFLSVQYDRFDLRYRISRYFGLNATRDEDGRYYFGVFFEKRFR